MSEVPVSQLNVCRSSCKYDINWTCKYPIICRSAHRVESNKKIHYVPC